MDTNTTYRPTFTKEVGRPASIDLDAYGCPDCGSPDFTRKINMVEYVEETAIGEWKSNGEDEITDYGDREYGDSESSGYEGGYECSDCYTEYDEDEAYLADNYRGEQDEDIECLWTCEDDECEGDCRTDADWPYLADKGVFAHEALGALLQQHAPHAARFAWDERVGFTAIEAEPAAQSIAHRVGYAEGGTIHHCTSCNGDMSEAYTRTIHLPYKQTRFPQSTRDISGRHDVTMQLRMPICYVCHKGS
jgi:hypothetical protein